MARHLWDGKTRLYFNAFEEAPLVWSVDDGNPDNERKVAFVTFRCGGRVVAGPRTIQPKCWVEFEEAEVWQINPQHIAIREKRV